MKKFLLFLAFGLLLSPIFIRTSWAFGVVSMKEDDKAKEDKAQGQKTSSENSFSDHSFYSPHLGSTATNSASSNSGDSASHKQDLSSSAKSQEKPSEPKASAFGNFSGLSDSDMDIVPESGDASKKGLKLGEMSSSASSKSPQK